MSKLSDKLAAYGADVNGAMDRFDNDEELYKSCLNLFLDEDEFRLLNESLQNKEYETALAHIHSLKGLSLNLGLTPLSQCIGEAEEILKSGEYEDIGLKMGEVIKEIKKFKELVKDL